MPIYEYQCECCGERFTRLQPMSAQREGYQCPACGAFQTRRIVSTFARTGGNAADSGGCGLSNSPFR